MDTMKNLYESIMDMNDTDLDYVSGDFIDMLNSNSEDEWRMRCDCLKLRLLNNGEIAPIDHKGYLRKKRGRLYIRIYHPRYNKTQTTLHFGDDLNTYILGWNIRYDRVVFAKSMYIRFGEDELNDKEYDDCPLYILPDDLKKSYREIITKL